MFQVTIFLFTRFVNELIIIESKVTVQVPNIFVTCFNGKKTLKCHLLATLARNLCNVQVIYEIHENVSRHTSFREKNYGM